MARNREIVVVAVVAACVAAGGAVGAMKAFADGTPGIGMRLRRAGRVDRALVAANTQINSWDVVYQPYG